MNKKHLGTVCFLLSIVMTFELCACNKKQYKQVSPDGTEIESSAPEYHIETTVKDAIDTNGVKVNFIADKADKKIYKMSDGKMTSVYISGVNVGLSTAITNLDNPDVSYQTYMEWFSQISEMHANTVRVFTEMPPQFYKAFYDYNSTAQKKLYLIHGIWFNENLMYDPADCWDSDELVISSFERAINEIVDIVHGNAADVQYPNKDNITFSYDVSQWVVGYILGLEWDNTFVMNSNSHNEKRVFSGEYLKTSDNASPFEGFLCRAGNTLIEHETSAYKAQTPVAFLNWSTNDPLTHDNEPYEEEDSVTVNTENILPSNKYYAGLFAAVDAYPYYPEFINYQQEYIDYRDELTGKQNNYKAYIKDLNGAYSVPLIIAEFGVPTSRGCASQSVLGYNQGAITEQQQGQYVSNMIVDIASSGCAGGLIFSWQDEWFKQTWNTFKYAPDNPEKRTPNKMSPEQNYGILAVEAGDREIFKADALDSEWNESDFIFDSQDCKLGVKYDEAYLYLLVKLKNGKTFENSKLLLPISTIGIGSNFSDEYNARFNGNADFVLLIDGEKNSAVKADADYDYFYYRYGVNLKYFPLPPKFGTVNSGSYSIVKQFVTGELVLPVTNETVEPIVLDCGKLTFGISDSESPEYNSLSDFYAKGDTVEIRLPWYLLNVLNINEGVAMNDFNKEKALSTTKFTDIKVGCGVLSGEASEIQLNSVGLKFKERSSYHTRLKKSYTYIQKTLSELYGK